MIEQRYYYFINFNLTVTTTQLFINYFNILLLFVFLTAIFVCDDHLCRKE